MIVQDYPAAGLDESKIYYRNDTRSFIEAAKEEEIGDLLDDFERVGDAT